MNNFGKYITPQEAKAFGDAHDDKHPLDFWERLAKRTPRKCDNCDEDQWKYGQCGMCFSCTTGEADASDDTEIAA